MALTGKPVKRPVPKGFWARSYLPSVVKGMWITFRHMFSRKVTMQYPEEKWAMPDRYRGLPALVRDEQERVKCVACFLCQYVCPPKAIHIEAQEIATGIEKGPKVFDINMLRCIMCGYCEEVCPEEAIFLTREYQTVGTSREGLVYHKDKLLEMGGIRKDATHKWGPLERPRPKEQAAATSSPSAAGGAL